MNVWLIQLFHDSRPKFRLEGRGGHNRKRTIRTIFCATKFQLYRSIKRTAQDGIENIEKKTQKLQNSSRG